MKKPKLKTHKPHYDYYEVIHYLEDKYKFNSRDYKESHNHFKKYQDETKDVFPVEWYPDCSGKYQGFKNEWTIRRNGKIIEATKEQYDADFKLIHEHYQRYLLWEKENPSPEYCDFWHWFAEHNEIHQNDCYAYLYINNKEDFDCIEEDTPDWVIKILRLLQKEFPLNMEDGYRFWIE